MVQQHSFLKRNGLILALMLMTFLALTGQIYTGWNEHNEKREKSAEPPRSLPEYLHSGHFIQATFENWESEFLQMGLYVFMTAFLFQKGSAESKSLDDTQDLNRKRYPHQDAPWPVKKGGLYLSLYQYSLSMIFLALFILSFMLHAYGTWKDVNEECNNCARFYQILFHYRFWFESFQNWQSEFLSVAAIVFFSIYLRHKGSPESKPVDAPHYETGR